MAPHNGSRVSRLRHQQSKQPAAAAGITGLYAPAGMTAPYAPVMLATGHVLAVRILYAKLPCAQECCMHERGMHMLQLKVISQ
jgi:hypothetical protein